MIRSPAVLLVWLLCPLIAVVAGYLLSNPLSYQSMGFVGLLFLMLLSPLLLKWHHELLIFSWNSFFIVFFLPGQPSLGIVLAAVSLFISVLTRTLRRDFQFIHVRSVTVPLLLFLTVVLITASLTGGIGARLLGSATFGGKRYLMLFGAIIGYFALTARAIPRERAQLLVALFFLSGLSGALSDLIYVAGPSFYFLYVLVSANLASMQALSQETLLRFSGLTWGALAACYFLVARYGIRGIWDLSRPWRLALFLMLAGVTLLGGFRSALAVLVMISAIQFHFEGLYRTRYLPLFIAVGLFAGAFLAVFADRMPLAVQRSLSFLPIEVNPVAKADATSTLDWRFEIWRITLQEVPKYLWLGKGFGFSGVDFWLVQEGVSRGLYRAYEDTLVSGNYHNGILTTIIPFGIFGLITFFWFCWAGLRVLHANYKYGDPELKNVNTFLLAFYVARLIFFLVLYGQLDLDLMLFTGCVGLSISLNGGVAQPGEAPAVAVLERAPETVPALALQPSIQRS